MMLCVTAIRHQTPCIAERHDRVTRSNRRAPWRGVCARLKLAAAGRPQSYLAPELDESRAKPGLGLVGGSQNEYCCGVSDEVVSDLLAFLGASPTPFHAVHEGQRRLEAAGFRRLDEADRWDRLAAGGYYVTSSGSNL